MEKRQKVLENNISFFHINKATSKTANEQLMISSIENGAVDHLVFPMSANTLKSLWLV